MIHLYLHIYWSSAVSCLLLPGLRQTTSNCGPLSSTCQAGSPVNTPDYLVLSSGEKLARIMNNVRADTSAAQWFHPFTLSTGFLFQEGMCPSLQ